MMLTQLEYFVAVAREQHFGRAAASCFVSQSALSEAIRKLETELGVPLVRRGRQFESLTEEGARVLIWAQRIVADQRNLLDSAAAAREFATGTLRIGVIPAATASAARLLVALSREQPLLHVRCFSRLASEAVIERVLSFDLDAGLIHPSGDEGDGILLAPVAEEPLVVISGEGFRLHDRVVRGANLAALPLCLLAQDMRARQILDRALATKEIRLEPRIETDSVEELVELVSTGPWVSVVPRSFGREGAARGLSLHELIEPTVRLPIHLATRAEWPRTPAVAALAGVAAALA